MTIECAGLIQLKKFGIDSSTRGQRRSARDENDIPQDLVGVDRKQDRIVAAGRQCLDSYYGVLSAADRNQRRAVRLSMEGARISGRAFHSKIKIEDMGKTISKCVLGHALCER